MTVSRGVCIIYIVHTLFTHRVLLPLEHYHLLRSTSKYYESAETLHKHHFIELTLPVRWTDPKEESSTVPELFGAVYNVAMKS
jgi:hypothetical protein